MRLKLTDYLAIALLAACVLAAAYLSFMPIGQSEAQQLSVNELATSAVWVGKDIPTTVVASSTGRTYLEIQNEGASSSTSVYCQTNGRTGAVYTGFTISPTTTRKFTLDLMYRGALSCRALSASTTVFVIEQ